MKITEFFGKYRWLSNFWPCKVEFDGIIYPSAEHAYQAQKVSGDREAQIFISMLSTPGKAKRYGKMLRNSPSEELFKNYWNKHKIKIMTAIVTAKFNQNPDLAKALLDTKDAELFEGNTWGDKFWGVDRDTLEGKNELGKILMHVREILKKH